MITRVLNLFRRYAARHASLQKPGFPLSNTEGTLSGHVEHITLREGRVTVEGWSNSSRVGVSNEEQTAEKIPGRMRNGILSATSGSGDAKNGFTLDLPYTRKPLSFWAEMGGRRYMFKVPDFTARDLRAMRRARWLPFLRDLLRAVPAAVHWSVYHDPLSIARVKDALGLNAIARSGQLDALIFSGDVAEEEIPPADLVQTGITIVLPVYNAFDLLSEVLRRVLAHTDLPWRLILIEDLSSDPAVRPWLRSWHAGLGAEIAPRVTLIENETNLGFIRSVNRALAMALPFGDPVVLLNSDAFVPQNWASRLIRPILDQPDVASVTPMSNDAEIFGVPVICRREQLPPGAADALDRVAARFSPGRDLAEAPTGVGFCMAMNIAYLQVLPELDTAFGRGYGEEVDWCQRARQMGGRHLGLGGLFVEHRGGTSFGSAEKQKLVRQNNAIVARRYPRYDADVQDFIGNDPLITPRLGLALAWAGLRQTGAVPVYLAHSLGGGAEHYLQHRIKADLEADAAAVVLRVGGTSRWQLELHSRHGITKGETESTDFVQRLLDLLPARRVIYSCAVGDRDPISLPGVLMALAAGPRDRIDVLIHDFLPLSPSYTLLGSDGAYHGVPLPETNTDRAHSVLRADGSRADLGEWRKTWGALMQAADRITVFSQNSRDIVARAYPDCLERLAVTPHTLLHEVPPIEASRIEASRRQTDVPVIGVLGNIGSQKGVAVLRDLSQVLRKRSRARLVVIGNIDTAYALAPPALVHGDYKVQDIPALVARYGISRWIIPSVWPETFSYTTHEAIATGLPVWSFDLGAQGDAVRMAAERAGKGGTLPLDWASGHPDAVLDRILADK